MVALLKRLEDRFPEMLSNVDLYAGTSTGSAIALSLANGKSIADLQAFYSTEHMKSVFGKSRWNFLRPRHSNDGLRRLLEGDFPNIQETEGGATRKLLLSDLKKKVLVTSFKLDNELIKSWSPVFFHNYPNEECPVEPSSDQPVVDVALRSTAAPTIFPSHQGHIDGGMVANNPSTAAIAIALRHNPGLDIKNIRLLSFGTGYNPTLIKTKTSNWGVLQWLLNPFNEPKEPLLTILFDGVVEADSFMSRELLGEQNYHRLNLNLPTQTACDDWREVPNLVKLANSKDGDTEQRVEATIEWIGKNWFDELAQISTAAAAR